MSALHGYPGAGEAPPAQTLALVADALAWPLLLLRLDGTLMHANAAARRLLRRREPLGVTPQGLVQPSNPTRRADFDRALQAAATGDAPQLLQWLGGKARYSVSLSALAAPGQDRSALLLALSPEEGNRTDLRAYAAMHHLSEAETRVLDRLARGESSSRAAAALGVTPATVRSQAVSLRRKTGHASVAALLQALASLPPLAAPPASGGEK